MQLKVVTALDTTSGRQYLVLHKIYRRPNELLPNASIRSVKPRVAPTLQVRDETELPEPETVIRGTVAVVHGDYPDIKIAKADPGKPVAWVSVLSGTWQAVGDRTHTTNFPGAPKQFKRVGQTRYLRGQFYRATEGAYTASGLGYLVATLGDADLPKQGMRFPVTPVNHGTGNITDADAYIVISALNNEIRLFLTRGQCGRIDMGQISWDVD